MDQPDCQSCTNKTTETLELSLKTTTSFVENCGKQMYKPKIEPFLGPITPDVHKETGDFPLDLKSPLSVVKNIPKVLNFDCNVNQSHDPVGFFDKSGSPKTPKDGVFDPFAPGPDDKAWAPQCKKYSDEVSSSVARRLDFGSLFECSDNASSGDVAESISDKEIFESVYENLLEAIVCKQTECVIAELSTDMEWDNDVCRTPILAPRLTGIADTCPGAPMKPTGKPRGSIDLGVCRKLEF